MTQELDRRAFLLAGSALPFVYGCDDLFAAGSQEDVSKDPEWLTAALKRMKDTGRWGLVVVAPDDPQERVALGRYLYDLAEFDDEYAVAHEVLAQAVLITVTTRRAAARFPAAQNGANRLLLSSDGTLLASDAIPLDAYKSPDGFAGSFKAFIHGPDRVRLKETARRMESAFPPAVKDAVDKLRSDDVDARIEGAVALADRVPSMTPYIGYLAELGRTEEARREARLMLWRHHASLKPETPGAKLPYGCSLGKFEGSCSSWVPAEVEVRIACGMGRVKRMTGKFISFLLK